MKRAFWFLIVIAVFAALLAQPYLRLSTDGHTITPAPQPQRPAAPFMSTAQPTRRDFPLTVSWMGAVESRQTVQLIAPVGGRVVALAVADEAEVSPGSLLLKLGGPGPQSRLRVMHTRIAALRHRLQLAQQIVTHKQKAVTEKLAAVEELLQAQDALTQRKADLATAVEAQQAYRAHLTLLAPSAGVFTQRRVSVGQDVEHGMILATLLDPTHLRIEATLFLTEVTVLRGRTAAVRLGSGAPLNGSVTRVLPSRTAAGGIRVWIAGKSLDRALHAGQAVRGSLRLDTHPNALAVPLSAVIYDAREMSFVFVQSARGFTRQRVHTGRTDAGWVEIVDGLKDTDRVLIAGAYERFYQNFNRVYKVAD